MLHSGTQTIETVRLLLRQFQAADAGDMFRNWVTDPKASRFWNWQPHQDIAETQSLLAGWIKAYARLDYYHWAIVHKGAAQAIGYIYLNELSAGDRSAALHYLISRPYWNQGLMTEACQAVLEFSFTKIGLLSLHTHHHLDNPASGKVLLKCGFRRVSTRYTDMPDCPRLSGAYAYYEISKEDWPPAK